MQQQSLERVTLVLGGVRSGKSRYAQQLAGQVQSVTFIATAERREDAEMLSKISRHQSERPAHWLTVEEPLDLVRAILDCSKATETILIDCLTLYAANLLEAYADNQVHLETSLNNLCATLRHASCPVILVSNEVGSGVVPAYALGRLFRDQVGEINQRIAALADTVIFMVAGLPLVLKSTTKIEFPR